MTAEHRIRFLLNGQSRETAAASTTLLDFIRETERLTGTKEGCAEGDCGACTVVVTRVVNGEPVLEAVNACITLMGQVDGRAVTTVEGLLGPGRAAHPVQRLLAETDGTQCGFCTPGFVMSLHAFAQSGEAVTVENVHEALAGNLCRCTGYRPIVDTALGLAGPAREDATASPLGGLADSDVNVPGWHAPRTLADLLQLRAERPAAVLVAGATDLGLGPSRDRAPIVDAIDVTRVPELNDITETSTAIEIGAAVTYARALPHLDRLYPTLGTYLRRLGSRQIRNSGTIGGNLGTASPIGDSAPFLLALDAEIELASRAGSRHVAIADFFTGYRKTALKPDDVITTIRLPKLVDGDLFRCDKVSKRYDQDISNVAGTFRLRIEDGRVVEARLAYGGMAATPKRAMAAEACLVGGPFDAAAVDAAVAALPGDLAPIDDMRSTAAYRMAVAGNLLRRFLIAGPAPAGLEAMP
ncbi:xanthine dehydrogenase small subunit [Desertibaculum subflavum]|uniref:xanthine dehydrogenase small subunit n=1 Tax=Desertibaculum subflavum TaxID=2268458 RepID=UPI000E675EAB